MVLQCKDDKYLVLQCKDDKYLVLQCKDDYENLCSKSLLLFKAIHSLYPNALGCFKCDDDIIISMESLIRHINNLKPNNYDYIGTGVKLKEDTNNKSYIISKNINITKQIRTPSVIYCAGPLYYLSKKAISIVSDVKEDDYVSIFYEDIMIGHILNKNRIFPDKTCFFNKVEDKNYPGKMSLYTDFFHCFENYSFHNNNKTKTIFIKIHGGLGNQIFQIFAGIEFATKNNMNYLIVNSSELKNTFTHIDDNNYLLNTIFINFNQIKLAHINLSEISHYIEKEEDCFIYNPLPKFDDDICINGYFQNEMYFLNTKNQLVSLLKENEVYYKFMNTAYPVLAKNSYFIHVRRGDYLNSDLYAFDTDKYYNIAIQHILSITPDAHFIIVSDDIEYCKTYAVFNNIFKTFMDLPVLETFYLMSLCGKGGICANSTFSWWGSYLNENPNKIVIFPEKWIQKPWPNHIFYENSIVVRL